MATFILLPSRAAVARHLSALLGPDNRPGAADDLAAAVEEAVAAVLLFADDLPAGEPALWRALADQYGFERRDRLVDCRNAVPSVMQPFSAVA